MKLLHSSIIATSLAIATLASPPVMSQGGEAATSLAGLEEIVVTGRKREENLIDVPVSISVFNADMIAEQGIINQQDLFEATPGLDFTNQDGTKNGAKPGIRGVTSELRSANQQKVTSFIDGMPMLGQTANLQFFGIDAVEVYRGPQSAAFGRSTFVGAINYVTADSADEFGGKVSARLTDLGGEQLGLMITGPIGESLGYRISYLKDKWQGPDEWTSTDGYELGSNEADLFSAKLNFEFSESVYGEVMFSRQEDRDFQDARTVVNEGTCNHNSGIWVAGMGADTQVPNGKWDCPLPEPGSRLARNHDVLGHFLNQYDANIAAYTASAPGADANGDGVVSSSEYLAQTVAGGVTFEQELLAQTVNGPGSPYPSQNMDRDRIQGEINFEIGDSLLQFMGMYVDETFDVWRDSFDDTVGVFSTNPRTMMTALGGNISSTAVVTQLEEKYAEVRWISPADNRLRYTLAGSYYDYDFQQKNYLKYGAQLYGLTTPSGVPVSPLNLLTISNLATNIGVSASVQYDLSDLTTFSLEARYQSDDVCGIDAAIPGIENCLTTNAFLPRIALTHAIGDNHSAYAQFSIGNNPAGVVPAYYNPAVIQTISIANGSIPDPRTGIIYDGSDGVHFPAVAFDETVYQTYQEEELYNFEIGSKGTYSDGRGAYTVALFYMELKNGLGAQNVTWDDTSPNGWNSNNTVPRGLHTQRTTIGTGDSDHYGIEFATDFAVSDVWTVGGYLTLGNAEYSSFCSADAADYKDAPGRAGQPIVPILSPANGDDVDAACGVVDGNSVKQFADVTGNLNLRAELPNDVFGLRTSFRADLRYKSAYFEDHMNTVERDATAILNLSATMRNENWNLRFFINNATDVDEPLKLESNFPHYADNAAGPTRPAVISGGWTVIPRRPREYGLQVTYDF